MIARSNALGPGAGTLGVFCLETVTTRSRNLIVTLRRVVDDGRTVRRNTQ